MVEILFLYAISEVNAPQDVLKSGKTVLRRSYISSTRSTEKLANLMAFASSGLMPAISHLSKLCANGDRSFTSSSGFLFDNNLQLIYCSIVVILTADSNKFHRWRQ